MFFGKVVGSIICSIKDRKLNGCKLLAVQKVNFEEEKEGSPI